MHPETAAVVAVLASSRLGVVSRQALVRAGLDDDLPTREVVARRWQRLLPGIFLTQSGPVSFLQKCFAAQLHAGRRAAITGRAGCALHELQLSASPPEVVDLRVPVDSQRASVRWLRIVRSRHAGTALRRVDGLQVAPLDQCVADAARTGDGVRDTRAFVMGAAADRRVDLDAVRSFLQPRDPRTVDARRALDDYAIGARSAPEAEVADEFGEAARRRLLPPFLLNPWLFVGGELLGSPDAWFVGLGLGNEVDSREVHGTEDQLDATLLRHERFDAHDLELNHISPTRFRQNPPALVRRIAELVVVRRRLVVPEPAGLRVVPRGPLLPLGASLPTRHEAA